MDVSHSAFVGRTPDKETEFISRQLFIKVRCVQTGWISQDRRSIDVLLYGGILSGGDGSASGNRYSARLFEFESVWWGRQITAAFTCLPILKSRPVVFFASHAHRVRSFSVADLTSRPCLATLPSDQKLPIRVIGSGPTCLNS